MAIGFLRRRATSFAAVCTALSLLPAAASAASLQIAPLLIELPGQGAATINLRNLGSRPIQSQIRIFRWTSVEGKDQLTPTDDVVVSPPMTTLRGNGDYRVRIVRRNGAPVAREESYRVLIDELPNASTVTGGVAVLLRQSIPVFVSPPDAGPPALKWSASIEGGKLRLTLSNSGGRRVRVARLSIGKTVIAQGLAGYALAGSSVTWTRPVPRGLGNRIVVSAVGDEGPLRATVTVAR